MVGNDVVCTRRRNRRGVIYLVWRHPGWRAHTSFENILELTETLSKVVVGSGRSRGLRHQAARIGNLYRCPNFRTVASERKPSLTTFTSGILDDLSATLFFWENFSNTPDFSRN